MLDSSDKFFEIEITKISSKVKYHRINPSSFNYGLKRQSAVNHCQGKFIVFTMQDAIPSDSYWLKNLVKPMKDFCLDAICGQQIVPDSESKNPVEWFRPINKLEVRIVQISASDYANKSPMDRKKYPVGIMLMLVIEKKV